MTARLLPLALVAVLSGCTIDTTPTQQLPKPSTDYSTDEIYPSSSAQDDGTSLTVYAALLAKGNFLVLGSTDRFVATVGQGPESVLASQGQTYEPHYAATFASSPDAIDVTLTLDRAGSDDPSIVFHMPPAFALDGTPPSAVKNNVSINVALLPLPRADDGTYGAVLEGDCVPAATNARVNILGGMLNLVFADAVKSDGPASCAATVKVQHSYPATVSPQFVKPAPPDAVGIRERRFAVTVTR